MQKLHCHPNKYPIITGFTVYMCVYIYIYINYTIYDIHVSGSIVEKMIVFC